MLAKPQYVMLTYLYDVSKNVSQRAFVSRFANRTGRSATTPPMHTSGSVIELYNPDNTSTQV